MTVADRRHWGPVVLSEEVGLQQWQFDRARDCGVLPRPEHKRGWSREQVEQIRALVPAIVEQFGAQHPIGAGRCAERLAERTGLSVLPADVQALAEAGHLRVAWQYEARDGRAHDLFYPAELDALPAERLDEVLTARTDWTAVSVSADEACAHLGWTWQELARVCADRKIGTGRYGRYSRADIDALAADEDLLELVRADQLVTADQAAGELLDIGRRHFDIAAENLWVRPARHHDKEVGRFRTVAVPLYRTGDVLALLERPDIDWEQVRACPKGTRSPLLELVGGRKVSRAKAIRSFLNWYGAEHGVEMWGWWVPGPDLWEVDWERIPGGPTKDDVEAAIAANPALREHRAAMQLHSAAGAAIRFARAMLEPGAAVILDTETTDLFGAICEIAVIDAATGKTLLNTLVNPGPGEPIQEGAYFVHRLTDSDVTAPDVPDWRAVHRKLLRVTKDRVILAYNASYDRAVVAADCARHGIRSRLAGRDHWADVMVPRSDHAHVTVNLPNGGGHRALDDAQQTRQHLLRMTAQ